MGCYTELSPAPDERLFFCLLEDGKLITKVSADTDDLLDPLPGKSDQNCRHVCFIGGASV